MKNYLFLILAITIGISGITGCSREESGHTSNASFNVRLDILQELRPQAQQGLFLLDFRKEANPEPHLWYGWTAPSQKFTWAKGLKSGIIFYRNETQEDLNVEVTCMTIPSKKDAFQVTQALLNGTEVGSFTIEPDQFKLYPLTLPASLLRSGQNVLEFRFSYTTKPKSVYANSKDARNLSVAFHKILLKQENATPDLQLLDDAAVLQHANAPLSTIVQLPGHFELEIQYRTVDKANALIRLDNDDNEKVEIELPSKKTTYQETIHLPEDGIYKISFVTEGQPESYTVWSQIQINAPEPEPAGQWNKNITSNLHQYDVIYVVLDAFDAQHSSLYGYSKKTTPFFEELAQNALVFANMFANAPYTLASTATLFTSRYPHEHGVVNQSCSLNPVIPTLSKLLSEADIETCLITKHGFFSPHWGLSQGFATVVLKPQNKDRTPDQEVIEALEQIYASQPQRRKFIYIHCIPPHSPYTPSPEFRKFIMEPEPGFIEPTEDNLSKIDAGELTVNDQQLEYITSFYDSNVRFADHIAEQIFRYLEERGLINRSIVIFTSDHGEAFMQHGRMLHNSTVFDEMLHVPFIVHFPKEAGVSPGRIEHIASLVDVTPTLLDIYGINSPVDFSGKSLIPAMFEDVPVNAFIYSETIPAKSKMIRDLRYKYILSSKGPMLFSIVDDPLEQHDIIAEQPIMAGYYSKRMLLFQQNTMDFSSYKVDLDMLDDEIIQNLRELGYIK